jgi:site-specific DNA-methyltransferase (adenine-specific)
MFGENNLKNNITNLKMATLLKGDCLKHMTSLPDKSVDCFICDLPYGQINCKWDSKIELPKLWEQIKRLCKNDNTPVLMFCNTKFGIDLINSNPKWFRYDLVWDKKRGINFLEVNNMPMKSHEMIYIFSKKRAFYTRIDEKIEGKKSYIDKGNPDSIKSIQYNKKRIEGTRVLGEDGFRSPLSVLEFKKISTRDGHPTEKPKDLYEFLLKRYCPEGGTVLDPTAGSFNSILVAKSLGLKGIGIEKDETYFNKAVSKFLS